MSSWIIIIGNIENSIILDETSLTNNSISASILGYGFTDFDLDGDIDIIISTTRDEPDGTFEDGTYYDNYYLLFFENINNIEGKNLTPTAIKNRYPTSTKNCVFENTLIS